MQPLQICIGPTLRIGQESWCLPYAGFLLDFFFFLVMFHSEIRASLNFNQNKILSPGLEYNHTLKCCFGNFPT